MSFFGYYWFHRTFLIVTIEWNLECGRKEGKRKEVADRRSWSPVTTREVACFCKIQNVEQPRKYPLSLVSVVLTIRWMTTLLCDVTTDTSTVDQSSFIITICILDFYHWAEADQDQMCRISIIYHCKIVNLWEESLKFSAADCVVSDTCWTSGDASLSVKIKIQELHML